MIIAINTSVGVEHQDVNELIRIFPTPLSFFQMHLSVTADFK